MQVQEDVLNVCVLGWDSSNNLGTMPLVFFFFFLRHFEKATFYIKKHEKISWLAKLEKRTSL